MTNGKDHLISAISGDGKINAYIAFLENTARDIRKIGFFYGIINK